jgi:hypothetical protein
MTKILIIVISILILGVCLSLSWTLYDICKKLKSIETDLMSLETRQRTIYRKLEYIHTSIYYVSSIVDKIDEKLTNKNNENKEK